MIPASKRRLIVVMVMVTALLAVLGARLWNLQIQTHAKYVALSSQDRIRDIVEPSVRGEILDDTGQPMIENQSALVVAVDMATVSTQADGGTAELARLAKLLKISDKVMHERVRLCTVGVPQPCWQGSPYQPIPVAQNVSAKVALQVLENKSSFPGVTANIQPIIKYAQPVATAAAQVLGYLQPITAQEVQQLHVPVTGFSSDDLVGQAGLEAQYDKQLRGTTGLAEVAVNAAGQVTSTIKSVKPVAGDDLVTSINSKLQVATQNILANSVQQAQAANPGATSGAAVVMTTTGRIIAMASYPTYDPSIWTGGISQRQFSRLFGTGDGEPILERATQGEYPPGSTFKVTTLTAGIKFGDSLYGTYNCPAGTTVGGHTFNNDFGNGGPMSLHQALVLSCDTVFYNIGLQIYQHDRPKSDTVTNPHFPVQFEQKVELDWGFGKTPVSTCQGRATAPSRPGSGSTTSGRTTRTPARTGASTAGRTAPTFSRSSTRTACPATSGRQARPSSPPSARATSPSRRCSSQPPTQRSPTAGPCTARGSARRCSARTARSCRRSRRRSTGTCPRPRPRSPTSAARSRA